MFSRMSPIFDPQNQAPIRKGPWTPPDTPFSHVPKPFSVLERWARPTDPHFWTAEKKAEAEAKTRNAMDVLLKMHRLCFPSVPVVIDGKQVPDEMLDDALPLVRLEADPVAALEWQLTAGPVAHAWRDDPVRWRHRPNASARRDEAAAADKADDVSSGIDIDKLEAPLVIVTGEEAAPAEAAE